MDQPYCLQRARFYGSYSMETSQVSAQDATNRCASPLHADLDLQPNFPKPLLPPMNKSTLHEMFRCETKIQIPRSIWLPALLRWALVLAVLIVPQAGRALEWHATVGAQGNDKGRQALAFLPNEIWIHAGDSITWTFDVDEVHTVTFIPDSEPRPFFQTITGSPSGSQFPDPTKPETTVVSSPGQLPDIPGTTDPALVKGVPPVTFTVNFPTAGNFKQVCLFHQNMTGVVHVLSADAPLPHNQDFYDREAADQRRDLLSDRDGRSVAACGECAAHDSLKARVVTAGTGEISATAGGTQTLAVMRFLADQISIRAGDTVEWTNQNPVEPHTVTFGTVPFVLGLSPFPEDLTKHPDPDGALHAVINSNADNVSSGIIAAAAQDPGSGMGSQTPLGPTRFRATFPNPGVFHYLCLLHDGLGMKGTVMVFPKVPPR
jgi:plastocyanin